MTKLLPPAAALTALTLAVALLAGCGSVGGSKDSARIRAVDAAVNAATANIVVNSSSANGDQLQGSVSPYLYISTGKSSFAFTTTATLPDGASLPVGPSLDLASGQFYTAFLIGRSDVAVRSTAFTGTTDPRFLQVIVANDTKPALAAGQAALRVIDAAPDAGGLDVLLNGASPGMAFNGIMYRATVSDFIAAPYIAVPAGNVSVQVNTFGTSTAVVSAANVSLDAGKAYTVLVQESPASTVTGAAFTPVYTVKIISDNN